MIRLRTMLAAALWLLAGSFSTSVQSASSNTSVLADSAALLTKVPDRGSLSVRGTFYVPAYSSQAMERGRLDVDFSVTLNIHNTSAEKPLVVERIAYYDIAGVLVQDYLTAPIAVRPFGTIEVFVAVDDVRGGRVANFVVDWAAAGLIAEPIMETLMLGSAGTHGYSFVSQGRPIRIVGEQP